jgi:hypothetical protein
MLAVFKKRREKGQKRREGGNRQKNQSQVALLSPFQIIPCFTFIFLIPKLYNVWPSLLIQHIACNVIKAIPFL